LAAFPITCPIPGTEFKTPDTSLIIRSPRPIARGICAISEEAMMAVGTVKFFDATRGFGFIQPEDGSKDVFVHKSAVTNAGMSTLTEGQRVSYEVVMERGKSAAGNLSAA
jgi:cold shock protein